MNPSLGQFPLHNRRVRLEPRARKSRKSLRLPPVPTSCRGRIYRTRQFEGVEVKKLRDPTQFVLQIFGKDGKWHRFKAFRREGNQGRQR